MVCVCSRWSLCLGLRAPFFSLLFVCAPFVSFLEKEETALKGSERGLVFE